MGKEDSGDLVLLERPAQSIYCEVAKSQDPRLAN
jgi:hypothetical protein